MRDAALVRRREHAGDLRDEIDHHVVIDRALGHTQRERCAGDQLHRDPRPAVGSMPHS